MTCWEYRYIICGDKDNDNWQQRLDRMGLEGWEVTGIVEQRYREGDLKKWFFPVIVVKRALSAEAVAKRKRVEEQSTIQITYTTA